MSHAEELEIKGYTRFPFDPRLAAWAAHTASTSSAILSEPSHEKWWRHQRTWFVGVDALPNDQDGRLPNGPPLAGSVIDFIRAELDFQGPWHRGQLSVCFPGYPQRDAQESEAQHKFRMTRDGAHVDGLHGEGPTKRRHFREAHQFILGIPLNVASAENSPLVVWDGSHLVMQDMFAQVFAGITESRWSEVDVTEAYHAARQRCFETCRRVAVYAQPGESYVIHKFALHGVAPWVGDGATSGSRMIAYFLPRMLSPIAIGR
jgi:hypothetical protein